MRTWLTTLLIGTVGIALAGCGGESSSSSSPNGSGAATAAPLKGKELGKSSQLVGTWLAQSEGDFIGFEFMKDGKVLVTSAMGAMAGLNSGMMMDYAVMDGGRLSMTAPGGMTQVYGVTVTNNELELKGQMMFSEAQSQRFRKLPAGQTLEQGAQEQDKAEAKLARERYDTVMAYIKQPGLVIVCLNQTPGAPASVAIAPPDETGSQKAYHDDPSPHLDQIYLAADISQSGDQPVLNVTFGQQIQPPPAQQSRNSATIPFQITGDPKKPKATASVTVNGAPYDLELRRDEKLYKQIVERFEAELARVEGLRKPLIDALKDYAVLEGDSHSEHANHPKPNTARIVLVRDAATGNYTGESILIDANSGQAAPMPNTTAEVTVIDEKPMLLVNCYNRQYQLELDAATGKLTGGWLYQYNPNGYVAELAIVEAMDAASRQQKHDAQRRALTSLSASTPLVGLVNTRANFLPQPGPVLLALTPGADGQVTGTATFPLVMAVVDVQGRINDTLAGPQLDVQFGNLRENGSIHAGTFANQLRNLRWTYRIASAAASGPITLTDGAQTLVQATDAYKAELRKTLTDAMAGGLTMAMHYPNYGVGTPLQTFQFKLDPATNKVSGMMISGPRHDFHDKSTVAGELKEMDGLPLLVVQIADPPPARQGDFHRTYTAQITACPTADGWRFTAPYWPDTNERSRQYLAMMQVRP